MKCPPKEFQVSKTLLAPPAHLPPTPPKLTVASNPVSCPHGHVVVLESVSLHPGLSPHNKHYQSLCVFSWLECSFVFISEETSKIWEDHSLSVSLQKEGILVAPRFWQLWIKLLLLYISAVGCVYWPFLALLLVSGLSPTHLRKFMSVHPDSRVQLLHSVR